MKHLRTLLPLPLVLLLLAFGGCGSPTEPGTVLILQVGPEKAPCMAMMPTTCLQVREGTGGPWGNFFAEIEGFTWEPGYTYTLRVRRTRIPNPPADGSSYRFVLLEELSRVPA